jgi:DNA-binding NtrC family response regulator
MRKKTAAPAQAMARAFTTKELLSSALIALKHEFQVKRAAILIPPNLGPCALLTDDEIVFGGVPDPRSFIETPLWHLGVSVGTLLADRSIPLEGTPFLAFLRDHLYRHTLEAELERHLKRTEALFVGENAAFRQALAELERCAGLQEPVLLAGESGTGKELFAAALHVRSQRKTMPFVLCNCSAFPNADLLVSDIFGHERGAFTGAGRANGGKLELARDGTLFLDEIGELSLEGQASLLRLLKSGEYYPIGSDKPHYSNIRLISATNQDLHERVRQKRFREDLLFRISAFTLSIPPLRERREDIRLLADYLLFRFSQKNRCEPKPLAPAALQKLEAHTFPGNIRELGVILKKAFVDSPGSQIEAEAVHTGPPLSGLSDRVSAAYESMISGKLSFWVAVKRPYLQRYINREEMWRIIYLGLKECGGSYQGLIPLFNLPEKDYPRFIAFLNRNKP